MDYRRSRSISPRRRNDYRRFSRSRSRERSREQNFRRRISRSRSRDRLQSSKHFRRGESGEKDLYRDLINDDYEDNKNYGSRRNDNRSNRGRENDYYRDERDRGDRKDRLSRHNRRCDRDSEDSDEGYNSQMHSKTPSATIMVQGLQPHITEADISSALIKMGMNAASIRLIRKRNTGASRCFAFVEFITVYEAIRWMELTQGSLVLPDSTRASLQYSHSREQSKPLVSDWYCGKCGILNFKYRENCFKCCSSREESETDGAGSNEISNILTKKIMLRNLDALTNEESVLTVLQQLVPDLAKNINKILVSRDTLTQTSRGICYLNFESLVDSMKLHNALNGLDPPLTIDDRNVLVTYCIDHENRQIVPKVSAANEATLLAAKAAANAAASIVGPLNAAEMASKSDNSGKYSLEDVPRLAEYSAAMYASTPAEHAQYLQYYTDYYVAEINKGHFGNLPTNSQVTEGSANSGAAVALSAIQRKQKKMKSIETTATQAAAAAATAAAAVKAALASQSVVTPKGNDGKKYPVPDVTLYQYDETSGYYYDPTTGLYYDAHSQYYYNSETGAYLYWDQHKSSYVLATPAAAAAAVQTVLKNESSEKDIPAEDDETKKEKKDGVHKHDKVKVAKKIVKDMEKWAKQLNQKKDYTVVATPQPIIPTRSDEIVTQRPQLSGALSSGYADLGFSILEKKKERGKLSDFIQSSATAVGSSKHIHNYASDSDEDNAAGPTSLTATTVKVNAPDAAETSEKDYVDFQKLSCLLCKRAFPSLDVLQKHLKLSNLHKENLQKYNMSLGVTESDATAAAVAAAQSYRDRAKERRLKYGEFDPPPPNRTRERYESEIKSLTARKPEAPVMPIGSNNVGNRLLQKMGWSEGQGLGRKNQGRTNIIEAEARSSTAGLGNKSGIAPGDDYKTYIKKMMKSRYESV